MTESTTDTAAAQIISPDTQRAERASTAVGPERGAHGRRRPTRLSSLHIALLAAAVLLVLLVVFLVQNAHTVELSFLGAHLHVSLAVAMLAAAVAGALIVGAAGAARIGQMRRRLRRQIRATRTGGE